jgi:excisionase family DNA binding protein
MTGPAILHRRLFRTKEAANYLAMSEWKLRRLIQDGSVPHIQDQEGGPFLLDLRDLDTLSRPAVALKMSEKIRNVLTAYFINPLLNHAKLRRKSAFFVVLHPFRR